MRRTGMVAGLAALGVVAGTSGADAETKNATLSVKVAVQSACGISGNALEFGTYTSGQTANLDADTSITYNSCGPGDITVEFDGGQTNSTAARKMKNGSNQINYNLYQDTGHKTIWGTDTNKRTLTLSTIGSGTLNIYGRVPSKQSAASGTYTDTVNITLTF